MAKNAFLAILLFFGCLINHRAVAQNSLEDGYALFLYNFAKYSSWPDDITAFEFVVYGDPKVTKSLKTIALNKKINGKAIKAKDYQSEEDFNGAQIIFVSKQKSAEFGMILKKTEGKPIMVVTEKPGMEKQGACVSFLLDSQNRLKFRLNENALHQNRLKMANSLKTMAE